MCFDDKKSMSLCEGEDKDYPLNETLHGLFQQQVEKSPDSIAIEFEDWTLSYHELNLRSNQLAHYLRESGIMTGHIVALYMARSLEMVIAIYGVLKAGAAYVPLDPEYPLARTSYMLDDVQPTVILTQHFLQNKLPPNQANIFCLDAQWDDVSNFSQHRPVINTVSDDTAYVIYTSGTTGKPKGVLTSHRSIVSHLLWMQDYFRLSQEDRVLQKTPYSFDVSVWEFFWPLLSGARLVIARHDGHKDPSYLTAVIRQKNITTLHFVPSMLKVYLDHEDISQAESLKHVICSGEQLPLHLQQQFYLQVSGSSEQSVALYNLYGPTEAAIDVTCWTCPRDNDLSYVPIGKPVANTQIYLLGADLNPVAIGERGEIYIGGTQLAIGYLNNEALTDEKFITGLLDHDPQARLYKTGDYAKFHHDGNIEFLGREDDQVKLSGVRIELSEINLVLLSHYAVSEGIVYLQEIAPGEERLIAYVVTRPGHYLTITDIRQHILKQLPHYMVPQYLVLLEALPLKPNGKLDTMALPVPTSPPRKTNRVIDSLSVPKSNLEILMAGLWEELLDIKGVSVHDMFFDLGGDSLLTLTVVDRFEQLTGFRLNPGFLVTQTLRQMLFDIQPVLNIKNNVSHGKTNGS